MNMIAMPTPGLPKPKDEATARQAFGYMYAILHSDQYRRRYEPLLAKDFPRLPLTGNLDLFHTLARLGGELIVLHLMESLNSINSSAAYRQRRFQYFQEA